MERNTKNRGGGGDQQSWQLREVHGGGGGQIVRSTSKKDRHSKVYTAKGLRDRRVRLAAQTAIQFYDVQDRLGYDRPSKAVDWLIQNAKAAIDRLDDLPRHLPPSYFISEKPSTPETKLLERTSNIGNAGEDFFSPPEITDAAAIAGNIKSFQEDSGFQINHHFMASTSNHVQDLSLSLQSFREQILAKDQHVPEQNHSNTLQAFYSGGDAAAANLAQNVASVAWPAGGNGGGGGGGEFMFQQPVVSHGHLFAGQREPLQSSSFACIRAWMEPTPFPMTPSSSAAGANAFVSVGENGGFFLGFDNVAARVQEEDEEDGIGYKPHFASSSSRH